MLSRARSLWRDARRVPVLRFLLEGVDRVWWARTIRRADVVDLDLVIAQGGPASVRRAVRAYVRGGFRSGMTLNPLFIERLVSRQLSDEDRVPALYAYLVNDPSAIRTSIAWDAVDYAAREPDSLTSRGGPVGHAWRAARRTGKIRMAQHGGAVRRWSDVRDAALAGARKSRSAGQAAISVPDAPVVVVCRIAESGDDVAGGLDPVVEAVAATQSALIVAIAGRRPDAWISAQLLETLLPEILVEPDGAGLIARLESGLDERTVMVIRGPRADIASADLVRLVEAGREQPTAPLWLALDGTVVSAGVVAHSGRPHHLLNGHPLEDAQRLGASVPSLRIAGDTWARRAGTAGDGGRVLTDVIVRTPSAPAEVPPTDARDTDVDELLAPTGLRVRDWTTRGPRLFRSARTATLADGSTVPSLRWALKIVAPPGRAGEAWGDTNFARGLGAALQRLGQEVVIDSYDARRRPTGYLDDVVLALRGPEPFEAQPGAFSILWIISHPDQITCKEVAAFDLVYAGSRSWAAHARQQLGVDVQPLLQCTDARRFRPTGARRGSDVLFVGTARGIPRPSVLEPIRAGIPVRVIGPDWRGWIPASAIAATGVPNSELPLLYESAGVVLNDHWPAMQRLGFVSNRLFDVVAAGGRAISDDVDGIAEIFQGAVLTYNTIDGLLSLLSSDLDRAFPDERRLRKLSELIREQHSFDARARTLLDAVLAQR